jgi:hypothetical protein
VRPPAATVAPRHIVGGDEDRDSKLMAARRLLIVMLVLLGVSSLAAALVGNRPISGEGTGSTIASELPTETAPPDTVPRGKRLGAEISVGGNRVKVVPIEVGDQLALSVEVAKADLVEIPALGLLEAAARDAPARFDVLATEPGSYGVRLVDADRLVARIEVSGRSGKKD